MTTLFVPDRIRQLRRNCETHPEHDVFGVIEDELYRSLPIATVLLPECTHDRCDCRRDQSRLLVKAYTDSMKLVHSAYDAFSAIAASICRTSVWAAEGEQGLALYRDKITEQVRRAAMAELHVSDALYDEVMAMDTGAILPVFQDAVRETTHNLVRVFRGVLDRLQQERIVGSIVWSGRDTCWYDFYRVRRSESLVGTQTAKRMEREEMVGRWIEYEITTKTRSYATSDLLEHHEHRLFNAARHQFPAPKVQKPRFVLDLFAKIPACLRPHIFVVEGDMLRECINTSESPVDSRDVTEELREVVRSGNLYSPAVTLAQYVLTGWSGSDLK